jgi:hypothetical protein
MIFNIRWINRKDSKKMALAPFLCMLKGRGYYFGDIVNDLRINKYSFAHLFTKREIRRLFNDLEGELNIDGTIITFTKTWPPKPILP